MTLIFDFDGTIVDDFNLVHQLITKELADVQETVNTIQKALKISGPELANARRKKIKKVGGFTKHRYITFIEVLDDDSWIDHYVNHPNRYPEISE